jgi:outer membrane protein
MRTSPRYTVLLFLFSCGFSLAQTGQQPPPFTAPNPSTPAATQAPGQKAVPDQQTPAVPPDAPLPQPDQTTVDLRSVPPMSPQPQTPAEPSAAVYHAEEMNLLPHKESAAARKDGLFNLIGVYHGPNTPPMPAVSGDRLSSLIRHGRLYLSLHDALSLAIENNLDVEVSRYNLLLAHTDLTRAKGGGNLRGIDYTVQQMAPGVGAATSPLLITATTGNTSSTNASIADLSQVTQTGNGTQQDLSQNGPFPYSPGPSIPLFDPTLFTQVGYLRRSNQNSLIDSTTTTTPTSPLGFVSAGLDYQQGFSTGAQLEAYADNAPQVLYANGSQYDPFHAPSTSVTLTQALLRGRGRGVNLRFIRIARLQQKQSRLLFEQQVLETVYGISRLYYDLVSLGENVGVKEQTLAAAEQLYRDDKAQVEEGTLAPIELTRAQALVSSNRLDLIQAKGEYRQQESILRQQLLRRMGDPSASIVGIVPTDHITVPDASPSLDISSLIADALTNRPDLAQASLQIKDDQIATRAARNNVKPALNVYANIQTRGSSLVPYIPLGSQGTGVSSVAPALTQGGLRLSTIYQGGIQLNLPLRNRIAQADAERDQIQLRQAEARSIRLENEIRQQVENAAIALESAHQAYAAAVESRNYQEQLLQAEKDKFAVGASTNFLIVQDQSYLAQARSTEVAARSDWMKAQMSLDRALGDLLEKNNILLDDTIRGALH